MRRRRRRKQNGDKYIMKLTSVPPTMDWLLSPSNKLPSAADAEVMKVSAMMVERVGRVNLIFIFLVVVEVDVMADSVVIYERERMKV
jgi:hypothetical protein